MKPQYWIIIGSILFVPIIFLFRNGFLFINSKRVMLGIGCAIIVILIGYLVI